MEMTDGVRLVWQLGANEAVATRKSDIGPIQFFCAATKVRDLLSDPKVLADAFPDLNLGDLAAEVTSALEPIARAGVDLTQLRRTLRARAGIGKHLHSAEETIHRSETLRALFQHAQRQADAHRRPAVTLSDMVHAMLADPQLLICRTLTEHGVDSAVLLLEIANQEKGERSAHPDPSGETPHLDRFGRDLTELARAGRLGPVIGRREEVLSVIRTLARRSKNSPVLIGEPGVGKTAVAELLAIRLASGKHQGVLGPRRIVELNLATLFAGAKHLGEREARLDAIIKECRSNPEVLLFIDELHTLVQAGGQAGSIDPKDIFKPALARGEIRCIGATTIAEYEAHIAPDPALERRFDPIMVVEPTPAEALEILRGLVPTLSAHHRMEIPQDALEAAVGLSCTYDSEHHLPDKAIDLIDKAAALERVPALSVLEPDRNSGAIRTPQLSRDSVIRALADKLGLPPEALGQRLDSEPPQDLEAALNERILGQTEATRLVAERLRLADAGLHSPDRPRGVFLFVGSTGTGKTEMARALADCLFETPGSLIRLDLSEYMEHYDATKLIGAPPGYIGHDEPGQLTGALRASPYSVVLLDEADKAHPRVLDLLLQVFDAGRITDAKGRTIDARHAVFVLTANVPTAQLPQRVGFAASSRRSDDRENVLAALKGHFRPEFLNRINATAVFRPLTMDHTRTLTGRHLDRIRKRVADRYGVELEIEVEVVEHLAEAGYSPEYGVRELERTIERQFDAPLGELLLSAPAAKGPVRVVFTENRIRFNPDRES